MDTQEVFALLDDAGAPGAARSRLYSRHAGTLRCDGASDWPQLLRDMQEALGRGLYAVPLLSYELGAHLQGIPAHPVAGALAQVLLFEQCERLEAAQVEAWIATRTASGAPAGVAGITPNVDEAAFTELPLEVEAPTRSELRGNPRSVEPDGPHRPGAVFDSGLDDPDRLAPRPNGPAGDDHDPNQRTFPDLESSDRAGRRCFRIGSGDAPEQIRNVPHAGFECPLLGARTDARK